MFPMPFAARPCVRRSSRLAPAVAFAALLLAPPAQGAPVVLTLEAAQRAALERGPAVAAARLEARAAGALARDAARRAPLRVELEAENWGGDAADAFEATAALGWTLERGGDRAARVAGADATAAAAEAASAATAHDVRAAAGEAFVAAWAAQERLALLREARADALAAVDAARERLRAGAAPAVEVARAEGEAAGASARVTLAAAAARAAARALAAHWDADTAAFDSLALAAPAAAPVAAPSAEAHPDVRAALAGEREAEAALRAARARRVADLDVRLGVRRFREGPATGFVAAVALPLAASGEGELAAARARRERAVRARATTALRLRGAAVTAAERHAAALAAWRTLAEAGAPRAGEALALLTAGYRAGRYGWADLAEGRRAALDAREAVIEAAAEAWRARLELERWTGVTPAAQEETR